jgi:hypothetical protein
MKNPTVLAVHIIVTQYVVKASVANLFEYWKQF